MKEKFLNKRFEFSASHFLPDYEGKCSVLHGHNFVLEIEIINPRGNRDYPTMIMDFSTLEEVVSNKILSKIDHNHLNRMFNTPTAEVIAQWIFEELEEVLIKDYNIWLTEVKLYETPRNCVIIRQSNHSRL